MPVTSFTGRPGPGGTRTGPGGACTMQVPGAAAPVVCGGARSRAGERQAGRPRIRGPVAGRGGGPFILPASTLLAGAGLRPFDPPQALARTGPAGAGKFLFPPCLLGV